MRSKSVWILAPLSVIASAVIAYALVFWTPWFGANTVWGDYYDTGWYATGYYDVYDYKGVQQLAKLQPQQFQATVEALFSELTELTEAQLYTLSAAGDDVCLSTLIDCQGVPGKNVRPFVEKALAHKQQRETIAIAAGGLDTSRLSLAVSIAAFLVSLAGFLVALLTFRRKRQVS